MNAATYFNLIGSPNVTRYLGWGLIALSALGIAIFAVPPYTTFNPLSSRIPLNVNFNSHIVWLSVHAIPSGIALIIGPFQFLTALRIGWRSAHRTLGKIYLCCVVLGSVAAITSTLLSEAGFAAQMGFALLTTGWLHSAFQAYRAARQGRFADHRIWMIRNYALTFAAVLLRVFLLAGLVLRQSGSSIPFDQIYTSSVWASILVSVVVSEWFIVPKAKAPGW